MRLPASIRVASASCALLLAASGGIAQNAGDRAAATQGMVKREDVEIVECLLPGAVRQLGNSTYLTQRRPIRTNTSECRIRGGEYVAYDRADVKSALRIWMATAQGGDADAQTNVGTIYERGIGTAPDYAAALEWYTKAANQGYSRALFNLGTLYEQGLGVPADKLMALNFYRRAWGLPEDNVIYESAARREQEQLRAELEKVIGEKDGQLQLLQKQLQQLQDQLAKRPPGERSAQADAEIAALKKWIAQLEGERRTSNERLVGLPKLRTATEAETRPLQPALNERTAQGLDFGRYYALVIGNQHYQALDALETPINDAVRAAKILREKYGFSVQILEDASDITMLKALNDLNGVLKANDNLLIYYAGHGARLKSGQSESGYWLPVNADAPPKDTFWVPNEQITGHLARLAARRVLVVADSCYAGLLSTDPSYLFLDGKVGYTRDYVAYKLPKRSRLLISSGGDRPVLDSGSAGHSVFADAFLDELESNTTILPSPELFARIKKRVEASAATNRFVQTPEFKSIKGAGHEVGDFFFVTGQKR